MNLIKRMIGAAKLDVATYDAIEKDASSTIQALTVVVVVAVITGIGSLSFVESPGSGYMRDLHGMSSMSGFNIVMLGALNFIFSWVVLTGVIWVAGTKLLAESSTQADIKQVARATGFAQSPGTLAIFGILPIAGPIILVLVTIWQLAAVIIAARTTFKFSGVWRAIVAVLIGWISSLLASVMLGLQIAERVYNI